MFFALLMLWPSGVRSNTTDDDAKEWRRIKAMQALQSRSETLEGHDAAQDEKIRLLSEKCAENKADYERLMSVVGPAAEFVKAEKLQNPRIGYWEELGRWACRTLRDCEIRKRFAELDEKYDSLDGRVSKIENKLGETSTSPQRPASGDPYLARYAPSESSANRPDRQKTPPWNHNVDAVLVATCVDIRCLDGIVHGNVFRDPDGKFVLARHPKTRNNVAQQ
jgi:hypothetical protein